MPAITPKLSDRSDAFFSGPVHISVGAISTGNKGGMLKERFIQHVTTEKKPKQLNEKTANPSLKHMSSTTPGK